MIVTGAGTVLRYALQVILARWLGPAAYGRFVVARGWGELLAGLPDRGYRLAVVRDLPNLGRSNPGARRAYIFAAERFTAWNAAILTGGAIVAAFFIQRENSGATIAGLTLVFTLALAVIYKHMFQGIHRYATGQAFAELMIPIVFAALLGVIWLTGDASATTVVIAYSGAVAVIAVWSRIALFRHLPSEGAIREAGDPSDRSKIPALFVGQLGVAVGRAAPLLVVGAILGVTEAAMYAVAGRISGLAAIGLNQVENVIAPRFAAVDRTKPDGRRQLQGLVDRAIVLATIVTVSACAVIAVFADTVLEIFGSEFADARDILFVLLAANVVNAVTGPAGFLVTMTGGERANAHVLGWHAIAAIIGTALAAWHFDSATAAALVVLTLSVTENAVLIIVARRRLGVWSLPLALGGRINRPG